MKVEYTNTHRERFLGAWTVAVHDDVKTVTPLNWVWWVLLFRDSYTTVTLEVGSESVSTWRRVK